MILGIIVGIIATHFFWVGVWVAWYYKMTKEADQPIRQTIREDFQSVRESIRRAMAPRN
jgi:hypothetical protein